MTAAVNISGASYLAGAAPAETHPGLSRRQREPEPLGTLPEPVTNAIQEAHEDGFETEEPDEALLAAIDELRSRPYRRVSELDVQIDGTAYVADLQLPELEVRLGDEELEEYNDGRVVAYDDEFEDEEVNRLVGLIGWDGSPQRARSSYVRTLVPEEVEAFLDSYDYVEDENGVSPIIVERHNWEPPFTIELRPFTDEDRWGQEVLDAEALEDDLREFLEAVIESGTGADSPSFVTDNVPESYFETVAVESDVREPPLVRSNGTVYYVNVSEGDHETMPVTVTAETAEPTEDGLARFTLTVEVTEEKAGATVAPSEPVELHSQIGLPTPLWIAADGEYHLLYSDRYEVPVASDDDDISWSLADDDLNRQETAVSQEISVEETLRTTYVVPATAPEGSYTLAGTFAALWHEDADDHNRTDGIYPFEVELTLTEI
ncbi:hypothetical protein CP557_06920 [Natrinema ejinorense]|uniref:Uncharacterized protein n=1 Tax=Natrinema ejinorense TaxID=373386 RepID=A0A2A5QU10_9EURY|nr:hypothetical protein CP557_06920 [Natrinema ejinorense]